MMAPKETEIDIAFFIILTDFVTLNKFCVLNEKPANQILAHNSSGSDSLNKKHLAVHVGDHFPDYIFQFCNSIMFQGSEAMPDNLYRYFVKRGGAFRIFDYQ